MKTQPGQLKRIHQLLNSTKMMGEKSDLVRDFTGGREKSSKEMLYNEANNLIKHLEAYENSLSPKKVSYAPVNDAKNAMRKKIIRYAHLMKWQLPGEKADMERINNWCVKYGQFKQPLNDHDEKELAKLVTQFENVYKSFLKGIANG